MGESLIVFTIGPVQRFIETARKTEDLWMGSYLLSYLNAVALQTLTDNFRHKKVVISPSLDNQALIQKLSGEKNVQEDALVLSTLPNRFVAQGNFSATQIEQVEQAVRNRFGEIAQFVLQEAFKADFSANTPHMWIREQFDRQIDNFLEIYWVLQPAGDPENYQTEYQQLERSLGGVKNCRSFKQTQEESLKCSLCGEREVLHLSAFHESATMGEMKKQIGADWEAALRTEKRQKYLNPNEYLCAVCLTKRMGSLYFQENFDLQKTLKGAFPSNSEVAVAAWKLEMTQKKELFVDYTRYTKGLQSLLHLPAIRPLTKIKDLNSKENIDGEWLFEECIQEEYIKKYCFTENDKLPATVRRCLPEQQNELSSLKEDYEDEVQQKKVTLLKRNDELAYEDLQRLARLHFRLKLSKYYAVIVGDGDNIGPLSGKLKTREEHRRFSEILNGYTSKAQRIVEQENLGKLLYSGGDDVVALANLDDLFPMLDALRRAFGDLNFNTIASLQKEQISMSIGVCIAHYRYPLGEVLAKAREMEKAAKQIDARKNAIGLSVLRHSGNISESIQKWEYDAFPNGKTVMDLASDLRIALSLYLSNKFVYTLRQEFERIFTGKHNVHGNKGLLFKAELQRLITRQHKDLKLKVSVVDLADSLTGLLKNSRSFHYFLGFLDICNFIAQGGRRE